jgi:hypothetical protein
MLIVTQLVKEFSDCILSEGTATYLRNPKVETFRSRLYPFHMSNPCIDYQLNAQFFYYITIYMLLYNPRHVSSRTMFIFSRLNCIIAASGIVTLCKRLYSTPVESGLSPLSTGVLYSRLQRVTIPDAAIIQFNLLKMNMVRLETCRGL